ncbi:MAG: 2Fe-2S iron-sulfur cluster binding domain-containing protein, partial [Chloroflexi bacterium]|nr:2Fe-2S iron-sulfur cluster binding domain-containing protein [Chloroflexota bacterium]
MSKVVFQPIGKRCDARPGDTLLEAAQSAGVALSAVCGGVGVCADCRVRVRSGSISPLNSTETDLLTDDERASGLRLACQVEIGAESEIVVDVPPESLSAPQRSQVEGEEIPIIAAPPIQVHDLTAAPPSHENLRGDWERVSGIRPQEWRISAPVLADLPTLLRRHDWQVRMITRGADVVRFMPPGGIPLGFAVDVGTTGLAAYLVDLTNGKTLAIAGATNPQIAYGEDVMARLTLAIHDPGGAARLQAVIIEGLNRLLHEVCAKAAVSTSDVVEMVAVGNTAMHHLLLGLPVDQLGTAPYVPAVSSAVHTPARALGLET